MRIKLKDTPEVDLYEWHEHFKIFPSIIDGHLVFCEKVQRRLIDNWDYNNSDTCSWEYRLIERKETENEK